MNPFFRLTLVLAAGLSAGLSYASAGEPDVADPRVPAWFFASIALADGDMSAEERAWIEGDLDAHGDPNCYPQCLQAWTPDEVGYVTEPELKARLLQSGVLFTHEASGAAGSTWMRVLQFAEHWQVPDTDLKRLDASMRSVARRAMSYEIVPLGKQPHHTGVYVAGRYGIAFPLGKQGLGQSGSVAVGAEMGKGYTVGLRFMAFPDPPLVYDADTPKFAFGPVVEFGRYFKVAEFAELFPTMAAGFIVGQSPSDNSNKILPVLTGGLGMRLSVDASERTTVFFTPELGFAPLSVAPYAAFSIGTKIGGKRVRRGS